jgi:HAD superfamily phosphoserine phosphatase-like hydrolase
LHHQVFNALFRGHCLSTFTEQVEPFLSENFEQMKKDKVIDHLNQARSSGHEILLLSNSPDFLVEPIARRLGISQWASTRYQIDQKGRFNEIACLMDGNEKARELLSRASKLNITPKQTTVYSDSYDDLPLLALSANPIAVDPDRKLRLISKQRNWKII